MSIQVQQWLSDYDSGKVVQSVEMGGISYGYEIAIQECFIEIIRTLQSTDMPADKKEFHKIIKQAVDKTVDKLDKMHGFSGAQVGAATNLASVFIRQTPAAAIEEMKKDQPLRVIDIKKGEDGIASIVSEVKFEF